MPTQDSLFRGTRELRFSREDIAAIRAAELRLGFRGALQVRRTNAGILFWRFMFALSAIVLVLCAGSLMHDIWSPALPQSPTQKPSAQGNAPTLTHGSEVSPSVLEPTALFPEKIEAELERLPLRQPPAFFSDMADVQPPAVEIDGEQEFQDTAQPRPGSHATSDAVPRLALQTQPRPRSYLGGARNGDRRATELRTSRFHGPQGAGTRTGHLTTPRALAQVQPHGMNPGGTSPIFIAADTKERRNN